jgi:hypothetical protein
MRLLHWTPRVLGILFAVFVSIFALDVFGAGYSFVELLVAFTMHMIPTFALVAILALAWRWPWVGTVGYFGFAAWYVATFRGFDWSVYVLLAGIPAIIGVLFLVDWLTQRLRRST